MFSSRLSKWNQTKNVWQRDNFLMASDRKTLSNVQSTFQELKSFGSNESVPKVPTRLSLKSRLFLCQRKSLKMIKVISFLFPLKFNLKTRLTVEFREIASLAK